MSAHSDALANLKSILYSGDNWVDSRYAGKIMESVKAIEGYLDSVEAGLKIARETAETALRRAETLQEAVTAYREAADKTEVALRGARAKAEIAYKIGELE